MDSHLASGCQGVNWLPAGGPRGARNLLQIAWWQGTMGPLWEEQRAALLASRVPRADLTSSLCCHLSQVLPSVKSASSPLPGPIQPQALAPTAPGHPGALPTWSSKLPGPHRKQGVWGPWGWGSKTGCDVLLVMIRLTGRQEGQVRCLVSAQAPSTRGLRGLRRAVTTQAESWPFSPYLQSPQERFRGRKAGPQSGSSQKQGVHHTGPF